MLHSPLLIAPSADFWGQVAHALSIHPLLREICLEQAHDLSPMRVVVPTFAHALQLKTALAKQVTGYFIPPRITTLANWLTFLPPDPDIPAVAAGSERLLVLYAELRQHAWLKKLFAARRNTDLLPLAQTLLTLCDELTQSLLPSMQLVPDITEERWLAALAQLSPSAQQILSDEAQLVWSIWKSQLSNNDAGVVRLAQMMRLAERAESPLIWISPIEPDVFEQDFLERYAQRQTVLPFLLNWNKPSIYASAWPELTDAALFSEPDVHESIMPECVSLCPANSLEQEALHGAQIIMDWLAAGKSTIAIIAQDRVVTRRIRALLQRAQVFVFDETGWKLSTTRAAATIATWFDVIAARAETGVLLDLLKSPFLLADIADKSLHVMAIETALRRNNVSGGWHAVLGALAAVPVTHDMVLPIAQQAALFSGRPKTLTEWSTLTGNTLELLGIRAALMTDTAGLQVMTLLDMIGEDCVALHQTFTFAEWRSFVCMQMESHTFMPPNHDNRVVMLPLNGARLRSFDAVLMVGVDAGHFPSQPNETLFFANVVRRELGLATRESRQRQQLRDFTEMLSSNRQVVLSWQTHKNGETNPVSAWILRLQLVLMRSGAGSLLFHQVTLPHRQLTPLHPVMPKPVAPQLRPDRLSASGYNSFVACPYQFFVTRMLGLSKVEELSDMPEKRDYGGWLHEILMLYHTRLQAEDVAITERVSLLSTISEKIFGVAIDENAAVLGYYHRWQKAIPAYIAWANERESQGWHFEIGEQRLQKTLQWAEGEIRLHGQIDRIDRNASDERAVLDYKTRTMQALRDKLKCPEDHQLAFYGLLSGQSIESADYVALEPMKDLIGTVAAPSYPDWKQMLAVQITENMQALDQGAALPANGIESICRYCDVRGLCRKGAW
jgi:ATP-dependent helicase/nuclease subunit B